VLERIVGKMRDALAITDYLVPPTAYRIPITDYRLALTAYSLPNTVYWLPITGDRPKQPYLIFRSYPIMSFITRAVVDVVVEMVGEQAEGLHEGHEQAGV